MMTVHGCSEAQLPAQGMVKSSSSSPTRAQGKMTGIPPLYSVARSVHAQGSRSLAFSFVRSSSYTHP